MVPPVSMPRVNSSARWAAMPMARGKRSVICKAMSRSERYDLEEISRDKYALIAPTGGAIDMSLSLRMTIKRESMLPALFMAS